MNFHEFENFEVDYRLTEEEKAESLVCKRRLRLIRKHLRENFDPFELDELSFRDSYRLSRLQATRLINILQNEMEANSRVTGIDVKTKVLIALDFYAHGCYQYSVGQNWYHPADQRTVSNIIEEVTNAINTISKQFIVFPKTPRSRKAVQRGFLELFGVPGILGLIDGTVIRIIRPDENEEAFYCYKGFHALNVQMTCTAKHFVTSVHIVPGSNNDQTLWNTSDLKDHMEHLRRNQHILQNEGKCYIIGDSGYHPHPVLLLRDPNINPEEDTPEGRYTKAQAVTRSAVERTFGLAKGIFRTIHKERTLHYQPHKAAKILMACVVLHNFRLVDGLPFEEETYTFNPNMILNNVAFGTNEAEQETQQIIEEYFT